MIGVRANTTISILSDETDIDEYGDPVDSLTVVASGIPASITEFTPTVSSAGRSRPSVSSASSESSTRPQVSWAATGRISSVYMDVIRQNCRILDERTGKVYIIISIGRGNNAVGHTPIRLELNRS